MLTSEGCRARRRRLWEALPTACDALILGDPRSLTYFADYAPSPFVFRSVDAGALLILEPDRATLLADRMMEPYLQDLPVDEIVAPVWYDGRHTAGSRSAQLVATARDVARRTKARVWGAEVGHVPLGLAEVIGGGPDGDPPIPLEAVVRGARRSKDPDELELIRRSIRAGEAGHAAALERVQPGMTEQDVFRIVLEAATSAAGEPVMIYGDFASGPRCATERGGPPTARVLEPGDLFLLDYSVIVHGYRGDFTNTFAVGKPPTRAQRVLFSACLEALEAGESALRPGVEGRAVDQAVKRALANRGLLHAFPSHSGHGLGLSHPEPPYLVAESTETLVVGDVVALEPGTYVPGIGGMRFERNYRITPEGFECLTAHRLTLEP